MKYYYKRLMPKIENEKVVNLKPIWVAHGYDLTKL